MSKTINIIMKCVKCGSTVAEDPSLSFYKFPDPGKNDILRAQVWAKFCFPRNNWSSIQSLKKLAMSHKVICSKHFDQSFNSYSTKNKELSKYAVPFDPKELHEMVGLLKKTSSQVAQVNTHSEQRLNGDVKNVLGLYISSSDGGSDKSSPGLHMQHSYDERQKQESLVPNTNNQPHHIDIDGQKQQSYYKKKEEKDIVPITSNPFNSGDEDGDGPDNCDGSHEQQSDVNTEEALLASCEPSRYPDDGTGDDLKHVKEIGINVPANNQFAWRNSMPALAGGGAGVDVVNFFFECNQCWGNIVGFRYVCVQCADYDLCSSCEARGAHGEHYVLRVPGTRPHSEVQSVVARVRDEMARHLRPGVEEMPSPCMVKTEPAAEVDPLFDIAEADITMYNNEDMASDSQMMSTIIKAENTQTDPSFISNDQFRVLVNPSQANLELNLGIQSTNNQDNKSLGKRKLSPEKNSYTESDSVLPNKKIKTALTNVNQSETITAVPIHGPNVDLRNIERTENTETANPVVLYLLSRNQCHQGDVLDTSALETDAEIIKCVIAPPPNSKTHIPAQYFIESEEKNKSTAVVLQKPNSTKPEQKLAKLTQSSAILPKLLPKPEQNFNKPCKILLPKLTQSTTKLPKILPKPGQNFNKPINILLPKLKQRSTKHTKMKPENFNKPIKLLPKPTQSSTILPKILPKPAQNFNKPRKMTLSKIIQNSAQATSTKQQNETSMQDSDSTDILPKTVQYFKSPLLLPIGIKKNSKIVLHSSGSPRVIQKTIQKSKTMQDSAQQLLSLHITGA